MELLDRLESHVKPTEATLQRCLLAVRQSARENGITYLMRFDSMALGVQSVEDFKDCLKNIAGRTNGRLKQDCMDVLTKKFARRRMSYGKKGVRFGSKALAIEEEKEIEEPDEGWGEEEKQGKSEGDELPFVGSINEEGKATAMMCQIQMNNVTTTALVDTEAEISTINVSPCKKFGLPIDETKTKTIRGFNGSTSRTVGMCDLDVRVGKREFIHSFHVVGFTSHKVIMGFDLMKQHGFTPVPRTGRLVLDDNTYVQCQVIQPKEEL
ncbi:hypothetical protein BSKO_12551 [Bryopsis sp. KO-2023]|nr:hypothetical protein BSKO_12551 [Bryopsis sp. KO-2023]